MKPRSICARIALAWLAICQGNLRGEEVRFPGIESYQPQALVEVQGLAGRHPSLVQRFAQEDVVRSGIFGSSLRMVLWEAINEAKWNAQALKKQFPNLDRLCGVVGVANPHGALPKLIYTFSTGQIFECMYSDHGECEIGEHLYVNPDGSIEGKLKVVGRRTYLVLTRTLRMTAGETVESEQTDYIRVAVSGLVFEKSRISNLPSKPEN